ncbi:unnamed protein product [Ranitomeya imitator]|uniref:Uncharacterized protein n=1 Tax=Ranitomeya imitator TaxID=111125 RepID=A0ABN9L299_9NEOB|nr:unnamed protein product [Ranitomeya imitator]
MPLDCPGNSHNSLHGKKHVTKNTLVSLGRGQTRLCSEGERLTAAEVIGRGETKMFLCKELSTSSEH